VNTWTTPKLKTLCFENRSGAWFQIACCSVVLIVGVVTACDPHKANGKSYLPGRDNSAVGLAAAVVRAVASFQMLGTTPSAAGTHRFVISPSETEPTNIETVMLKGKKSVSYATPRPATLQQFSTVNGWTSVNLYLAHKSFLC
jgi:hypothetical protein